jgi:hypothetical protein
MLLLCQKNGHVTGGAELHFAKSTEDTLMQEPFMRMSDVFEAVLRTALKRY